MKPITGEEADRIREEFRTGAHKTPFKSRYGFENIKVDEVFEIVCKDEVELSKTRNALQSHARSKGKEFATKKENLKLTVWRVS